MARIQPHQSKSHWAEGKASQRAAEKALAAGNKDEARKLYEQAANFFGISQHPEAYDREQACRLKLGILPAPVVKCETTAEDVELFYGAIAGRGEQEDAIKSGTGGHRG